MRIHLESQDLTVETPSHRRDLSTVERLQGTEQDEPDASSLSCSADEHQDCRSPKKVERSGGGAPRTKQLKNESDGSDQPRTALKKPDKLLPCPRCNSSDTKFCYYNNYNVNQPRHFCKNCQRYWTAGGTMRNVPVGAGRRKSKHAGAAHCRHLPAPPEAAPPPPQVDCAPCQTRTVLKFGADAPLCESMAAVLHLGDQKGEDPPAAAGSQLTEKSTLMEWPYLWAPGSSLQTGPFWGYGPGWPNKAWSFSWAGPAGAMPFPSSALGKHCRDSSLMAEEKTEKSLWIPKTLRIVDPDEAAKSSIWSTLGIKPDPDEHADKAGIFKGFQPKKGGAELRLERESVLHLNPAAFSRSQTFQEST